MARHDTPRAPDGGTAQARCGGIRVRRRTLVRALATLAALPALRLVTPGPLAAAQGSTAGAPDFSAVTTRAAARRLVREGRLVEITLFPAELGGPDEARNRSFTTPEAAQVRAAAIATLGRYVEEDVVDQLDVIPDYKGASVVPSRLTLTGTHSRHDGRFRTTIAVW